MLDVEGSGSVIIYSDPDLGGPKTFTVCKKIRTPKKPANTKSRDTVAVQHPPTPTAPSPSPRRNAKRQTQAAAATPAAHLSSPE